MRSYTKEDVYTAITKIFLNENIDEIQVLLNDYGKENYEYEQQRVHLAILKLSKGDKDYLLKMIELAKTDYRDALLNAECENVGGDFKDLKEIDDPYRDML